MRELFWSLGWIRPVAGSERTKAEAATSREAEEARCDEPALVSEDPEPSTWIAVLEAHAALGHGAMPRRFVTIPQTPRREGRARKLTPPFG
jgi:hypothetical protein